MNAVSERIVYSSAETSVIDVVTMPKMKPRTRTLNVKYHHFRDYVFQDKISIHAVRTQDHQGDLFTHLWTFFASSEDSSSDGNR